MVAQAAKEETKLSPEYKKLLENARRKDEMYAPPNRSQRRRKPQRARVVHIDRIIVPENAYTKATHSIKKIRKKNAKRNEKRRRAAKRAGKVSQENTPQVS